jgi:hypothetical protein
MSWKTIRVGGVSLDLEPPAPDKITFVGSRRKEIPDAEFEQMATAYPRIARALAAKGIIAVSGGADGMDMLAEESFGAKNVISYRTELRGNSPRFVRVLDPQTYAKAEQMVAAIHPAWDKVKPEHRALHARNMAQVLGDDLRHPTSMLVCWAKPKGASIDGGTRSAYELSRIVHGGEKTYNLATRDGQRGFADELRALGVPIERGTWFPRETLSLSEHAKTLLAEGHARIGIAIPVGPSGVITNAERTNISQKYAEALTLAKTSTDASIIGDAWQNRVVLIAVPRVERDEAGRKDLFEQLDLIAKSNNLSRVILPHTDIEPNRDVFKDAQRILGTEGVMDSPFTFATTPEAETGLSRSKSVSITQSATQTRDRGSDQISASR